MGSQRRMFSRRSVVGLVLGVLLGFNLASWFAIPVPNRTDINIEVIAQGGGLRHGGMDNGLPEFRVGSARVRYPANARGPRRGKDCDDEAIYGKKDYGDNLNSQEQDNKVQPMPKNDVKTPEEAGERNNFDDFDLEEERARRQKELDSVYESDMDMEPGEISQQDRLEDFRPVPKAQKYVNYDAYAKDDPERKSTESRARFETPRKPLTKSKKPRPVERTIVKGDGKNFMYIGVLTAQKYLTTRGRAIMQTWGPGVAGKVEFYVGEGVKNVDDGEKPLPLVRLTTVRDDVYPPQKKSFLLLKQMYDTYLDSGYQWFMRADDDVYIKTEKLERFLRRLNSSQPIFLGQTGLGNAEERGRLSLNHGENYCMGGPGMIFSREVLRRVGPHIRECVKNLYSWHEDVELSRCVRKFANVNCAWSYQMQELFYEHYYLRKGYIDPNVDPSNPKLYSAMTLHPNKNPAYQVKLHSFMGGKKIIEKLSKIKLLQRDVLDLSRELDRSPGIEEYMLGLHPTLHRFRPKKRDDVIPWDFINDRLLYASPPHLARRAMPSHRQVSMRNIVMQVMRMMNENAKVRGRVIDFKQIAYGYRRVNPLYGAEYILDLLLIYKRYKGKKMTLPVRRHAYLQQSFVRTEMWEDDPLNISAITRKITESRRGIVDSVFDSFLKGSKSFLVAMGIGGTKPQAEVLPVVVPSVEENKDKKLRMDSARFTSYDKDPENTDVPTVNLIVPLVGRVDTFRNFMTNLAAVSLSRGDPVSLLVVLFKQTDPVKQQESDITIEILNSYAERFPLYDLRHIQIGGEFSRGMALEIGASHFSNDSLLFFCDVDVVFDTSFTRKCRANSVRGSKVYYPILFSEYHPQFDITLTAWRNSEPNISALEALQDAAAIRRQQSHKDHFEVTNSTGYWRNYGYGLLCVHQSDFINSGGFNIKIQGWGLEDVDLVDKFVSGLKTGPITGAQRRNLEPEMVSANKRALTIVRTPDPSLVHVYHPSTCNPDLAENQLRMCRASRASGITSVHNLAVAWRRNNLGRHFYHPDEIRDPVSDIVPLVADDKRNAAREKRQRKMASQLDRPKENR
uniref:Hexosyltransferase n=1 Tax=Phallusia mammillata TaxID=59560 RepID=A0A6F9D9J0_9ASCI|nr:chondroitin sulfate synthase 1 [Phallusia mammillata]